MSDARRCAIEGCPHDSARRGWCWAHYGRWQRNGTPRGGRPTMHGEPMRFFREVVLLYDGDECFPWPFDRGGDGYGRLKVAGRKRAISRLVCEEEHGPPPTPEHEAAHGCGKGHEACCAKRHLSWKTPIENAADKVRHGTNRPKRLRNPATGRFFNMTGG